MHQGNPAMASGQQPQPLPRPHADAETTPAATEMSPPERRRLLLRRWRCSLGLLLALAPAAVPALLRAPVNEEDPRSAYAQATPDNVIARLQKRIDSGQVTLAYDSKQGYLPAVLKALQIPASSQML